MVRLFSQTRTIRCRVHISFKTYRATDSSDVEGTGDLAIVFLAKIVTTDPKHVDRPEHHQVFEYRLYAIDAVTSDDLPHFPISLGSGSSVHSSHAMPQPLLIDLHEDQRHWLDQIHGLSHEDKEAIKSINKNAAQKYDSSSPRSHGGNGRGLHIGKSTSRQSSQDILQFGLYRNRH